MQTRLEYTLYGHFIFLKKLFGNVEKVRFFLDQESGVRAACLAAFAEDVRDRRADALFVRIAKGMTIDQKREAKEKARMEFLEFRKAHPEHVKEQDARLAMLVERLQKTKAAGKWNDRWLEHPFPSMSEPEKASCHLTELGDMDVEHQAWLHNKASLHGVDSLFNRIRRRVSMLERGMHSSANAGRVWSGYAPYHPSQAAKALEIMRVVHNYILPRETSEERKLRRKAAKEGSAESMPDPRTPAQRLGLARAPVSYEDILYFK
jgi:hypothetical protein